MPKTSAETYHPFGALRFFLAMLVVLSHTRGLGGATISSTLEPWGVGNIGVMAFFVLSGFIISEAIHRFYWGRMGAFVSNRLLRIVPPYLFALVISFTLHVVMRLGPDDAFVWSNLIVQPILPIIPAPPKDSYSFVRYIWAVQVEFYFYLICAIACLAYARFRPTYNQMLLAGIGLALVSLLAYLSGRRTLYVLAMLPYFAVGVLLYWGLLMGALHAWMALFVAALMSAFHFYGYTGKTLFGLASWLGLAAIAGCVVPLWHLSVSSRYKTIDQKLGDLSYPIYLNHYAIVTAFYAHWPWRNAIAIVTCMASAILVSWMAARLIEPLTRSARTYIRGTSI